MFGEGRGERKRVGGARGGTRGGGGGMTRGLGGQAWRRRPRYWVVLGRSGTVVQRFGAKRCACAVGTVRPRCFLKVLAQCSTNSGELRGLGVRRPQLYSVEKQIFRLFFGSVAPDAIAPRGSQRPLSWHTCPRATPVEQRHSEDGRCSRPTIASGKA